MVQATPRIPSTSITPSDTVDIETTPLATPDPESDLLRKYTSPLYTEINIPLPSTPTPAPATKQEPNQSSFSSPSKSRHRSRSLSSLSPFHCRRGSSPTAGKPPSDAMVKDEHAPNPTVTVMKNLTRRRASNNTVDALAVVPAVLMLSAELFTPEEESEYEKKNAEVVK